MAYQKGEDNYKKQETSEQKQSSNFSSIKTILLFAFIVVIAVVAYKYYNNDYNRTEPFMVEEVVDNIHTYSEEIENSGPIPPQNKETEEESDMAIPAEIESVDLEKTFTVVEQMPVFPGGEKELYNFIRQNLKYPAIAKEAGIQGRVTTRFVVDRNGKITDVQILRGIHKECDEEAVRLIKSMPSWIPGKEHGVNVSVYFTLPILFKLNN